MRLRRVSRLDSIPLTSAYFTSEGYLRDSPIVTTCGIFEYQNDDGSIHRELRLPEDVFSEDSLKTYRGKPIIVTHDAGEVTKDNVHQEIIGTMLSDGFRDGDNVRADIVIHDSDQLKSGLRELSLGYECELEEKPGTWEGKPYDAIQHNIRINHLALVEEARAGHEARLNLDGKTKKGGKSNMKKFNFDSVAGALTPEQLQAAVEMYMAANPGIAEVLDSEGEAQEDPIDKIRANADRRDADMSTVGAEEIPTMHEEIKTLLSEIDKLNGANDMTADGEGAEGTEEAKTDSEETEETEIKADEEEETKADGDETTAPAEDTSVKMDSVERNWAEMYSICQMASKLGLGDGFIPKSVVDGKKQIIRAVNPKMKLDGKSRDYVDGAYQIAVQQAMNRKTVAANIRKVVGDTNQLHADSAATSSAEDARNKMMSRMMRKENK